ncbi:hypothetical protein DASB73_028480 [Starmerella bacillaris]|uniref:Uncharacterized protein n=1 Tax=Starmerella bacillaris TaxID=1247836 RepID=A0AAV5RKE5_STABA|nr:hypothetical protein DASB73_028480 [Starmerella bacillaris]
MGSCSSGMIRPSQHLNEDEVAGSIPAESKFFFKFFLKHSTAKPVFLQNSNVSGQFMILNIPTIVYN